MAFEDVEKARKKLDLKSKKIWRIGLGISAFLVVVFVLVFGVKGSTREFSLLAMFPAVFILIFSVAVVAIVYSVATKRESEAYRKAYKAHFVEKIMKETFTDLKYNHSEGLSREVLKNTGMVRTGDSYRSNDLTVGRYKNVEFSQADVHIQVEETDSEGHTYYVTIFKGRFMFFEFPKKFDFRMEIIGKGAGAYRVPRSDKNGRKFSQIETESVDFNRQFKVFTEDGFEMFYILDPAFIEKIQAVSDKHGGRVMFGFLDNKLLVGLNDGKDAFEPPKASVAIDEKMEMKKNMADIQVITDFVDFLRLDKKLFE